MTTPFSYITIPAYKYELIGDYKMVLKGIPVDFQSEWIINTRLPKNKSVFCIKKGHRWDGASGVAVDTDNFMRGSLLHDALYQAIREGHLTTKYRKLADKILFNICRQDGMSWSRANWVYYAVRLFGGAYATPKKD